MLRGVVLIALVVGLSVVCADEDDLVREILAEGRGARQETGTRDQWQSHEHLGRKERISRDESVAPKTRSILEANGIMCTGCDEAAARDAASANKNPT